jgi:hypothetical protein
VINMCLSIVEQAAAAHTRKLPLDGVVNTMRVISDQLELWGFAHCCAARDSDMLKF